MRFSAARSASTFVRTWKAFWRGTGAAGKGKAKRRGDSAYYAELGRKVAKARWGKMAKKAAAAQKAKAAARKAKPKGRGR